ncbi:MAG TPA: hypothetical protein VFM18_12985, partial [Methanosarcina sp.]|nr:hypothetical protein [Methanosarcina sp.]
MKNVSTWILVAALTVLPGCATFGRRSPTVVEVPVPVPCKTPSIPKPNLYFDKQAKKDMTLYKKVTLLWAQDLELKAYSEQLEAALNACSGAQTVQSG